MLYEISSVTFGIMSDDDVIGISACLVTKDLYDPRMGPTDNGLCVTYGKTVVTCPGHFGHIRLPKPIFHPLFIKILLEQLKSTCSHCKNPIIRTCPKCKIKQPLYKISSHEILRDGTPISPTKYPKFCMGNIPVLPHCARPRTNVRDDDLTLQYVQVLKLNKRIGEGEGNLLGTLSKNVHALMDNSNGLVKVGMHFF